MAEDKTDIEKQELIFKLSMFEQHVQQIQQQLQAIEQGIVEMKSLSFGIEELKGTEGKEILAPIGRGVFVKAKLLSEKLVVDIGKKNFVTKDIPGTQDIISEQINKLEEVKETLEASMEDLNRELNNTINSNHAKK
jgi:prefoldin alpha subunit